MTGFIKDFKTFKTLKSVTLSEWSFPQATDTAETGTVVVPSGQLDVGDVGQWLITHGALLRISAVTVGTGGVTAKCGDIITAFDRDVRLADITMSGDEASSSYSTAMFMGDLLAQLFKYQSDAHYAMPYLSLSVLETGGIRYVKPNVDGYGRFNAAEYLRTVAAPPYNQRLNWSLEAPGQLKLQLGYKTGNGGVVVLDAGRDTLAEAPTFSTPDPARITVLKKSASTGDDAEITASDYYLLATGEISTDGSAAARVDGGWEYITVTESTTDDEILDKVRQRFKSGMNATSVSFFSPRVFSIGAPMRLRVSGKEISGYIAYKGIQSGEERYLYRVGSYPVRLTDRLRLAAQTAKDAASREAGASSGSGGGATAGVTSVNGKTGDVTGAQAVADAAIAPKSVNVGGAVTLTETSDGRGVVTLYDEAGNLAVKAYANSGSSGGEVDVYNGDGKVTAKFFGGNSGSGGALSFFNPSGARRAYVGLTTAGAGTAILSDASGNSYTLTPALIQKLINL